MQVVDQMRRAAQGAWTSQSMPVGLCDSGFFTALIAHKECQASYAMQAAAGDLQAARAMLGAPMRFVYGGILFIYYPGTDDASTVAVPANTCKFFPVNAPGA